MRALDRESWREEVLWELFEPEELFVVKLLPPAMLLQVKSVNSD